MAEKLLRLTKQAATRADAIQLVEGDNETYAVTFVISRYWGGVDLNTLAWSVNMRTESNELYTTPILVTHADDEDIYLDWTIGHDATVIHGNTFYTVEGLTSESDTPVWRSALRMVEVSTGIDVGELYTEENLNPVRDVVLELQEDIIYVDQNTVHYDKADGKTGAQKGQARANTDAAYVEAVEAVGDELRDIANKMPSGSITTTWAIGMINATTGQEAAATNRVRSNFINAAMPNRRIVVDDGYKIAVRCYDSSYVFMQVVSPAWYEGPTEIGLYELVSSDYQTAGAAYARIVGAYSDDGTVAVASDVSSHIHFIDTASITDEFNAVREDLSYLADAVMSDDVNWAAGQISAATGLDATGDTRIRTTDYITVNPFINIEIGADSKVAIRAYKNDVNKTFVPAATWFTQSFALKDALAQYASPDEIGYVRLVAGYTDDGDVAEKGGVDVLAAKITVEHANSDLADDVVALQKTVQPGGTLPTGTDFNTLLTAGKFFINASSNYTYINSPLASGTEAGTLEVFSGSRAMVQRVTRYSDGKMFVRTSTPAGSFENRGWNEISGAGEGDTNITWETYENTYNITCEPSITTDTHNYLTPSGDTTGATDTGAIQTMLNTTGVCQLGPGIFYVRGVEIPDYGMLRGCGNATTVTLVPDDTVNDIHYGYAVKLNDYCTVRDMRLLSADIPLNSSTWPTNVSETVRNRHGILYQGTAIYNETATTDDRRFGGCVDGLLIEGFAGGGITLHATGGAVGSNMVVSNCHIHYCDAGINVAYYSEFSRFTNISCTSCYYGCVDNGGNVNFANCSFSGCWVGIMVDNNSMAGATSKSPNNTHGSFVGCTICHSDRVNVNPTEAQKGKAIHIKYGTSGEVFSAMQIFYGEIDIENSDGIRFVGANLGARTDIKVTNTRQTTSTRSDVTSLVVFSDCTIRYASDTPVYTYGSSPIALKFINCFTRAGADFNPTPIHTN